MSYTPTEWKTGDVVTSTKLNKLEQGVANAGGGSGVLVVNVNDGALDKTWQEIHDAGFAVTFGDGIDSGYMICVSIYAEEEEYGVSFWTFGVSEPMLFIASSATGYPQIPNT